MSKIIDRTGSGSALTAAENDANLSSLSGINESQTGTTYTVTIDDQNRTIELSNASPVTVTLTLLSTITGALHTDDFRVILKNIGAGVVTINTNVADTFDDTTTSITLNQYDAVEIQSSSTATIWNKIRFYDDDAPTLTGTETFTNKTLTSPTVNTPTINGSQLDATGDELDVLDGVTGGTVTASKGVVVDANKTVDDLGVTALRADTLTADTTNGDLAVSRNGTGDFTVDGVPIYGLVMANTPVSLFTNTSISPVSQTAVDITSTRETIQTAQSLPDVVAQKAIIMVQINVTPNAANGLSNVLAGEGDETLGAPAHLVAKVGTNNDGANFADINQITVNLASGEIFDYAVTQSGTAPASRNVEMILVGWYV